MISSLDQPVDRYDAFDDLDMATRASEERNFDVQALVALLRRNLALIVATLAVAVAIGAIVTLLSAPRYRATATVQVDQQIDRVLDAPAVQSVPTLDDADRFLQTQIDVVQSRAMAERVVRRLGVADDAAFWSAMGVDRPERLTSPERQALAAEVVADRLSVHLPRQSRVLSLAVEAGDPQTAARIANAYAETFIAFNLQRKFDASTYARDFLSTQLTAARARLEGSERALNDYARANRLLRLPTQTGEGGRVSRGPSTTSASLSQLTELANQARARRIEAEQQWRTIAGRPSLAIADVLAQPAIQALTTRRAEVATNLQNELAVHQDAYPTVLQLRAQLREIDGRIDQVAGNIKASIRDRYRIAANQEAALARQVSQLTGATLGEQDRGVRYDILAREADTNRTLYEGLLQRFKEVSAQAGITSNNIALLDRAKPPGGPVSPRPLVNLLIALLIGIAAAGMLVFAREQLDDAIRGPEDLERKLGLVPLGLIPIGRGRPFDIAGELADRRSQVAEAYHTLRTNLLFATPEGIPPVLSLTSTMPTEGKSTTAYAIAHDLAELGRKVVLLDLDLRRPSLHRLIGTTNERGMTDLMTGQADFASVRVPTALPTLDVVTAGPVPPNPTHLLSGERLPMLLGKLRADYDVVIIDGPPVLGLADATILAALSAATVFVVEAARAGGRGATKSALRRLRGGRAHVLGAVLTKFDPSLLSSDYYRQYYRYGTGADRNAS